MQVDAVREAVAQVGPMFVDLIVPPAPEPRPEPAPPPPARPMAKTPRPPAPTLAAAPAPEHDPFAVEKGPHEPEHPAPRELPATVVEASLPPAPPPPPAPVYPRASRRLGESGRVTVRVFVGAGLNARGADRPVGLAADSKIFAPHDLTADAMAQYNAGPLSFKLNLTNLTDEHHADQLYPGHYIPGKPRTVQLTTAMAF